MTNLKKPMPSEDHMENRRILTLLVFEIYFGENVFFFLFIIQTFQTERDLEMIVETAASVQVCMCVPCRI